MQIQLGEGGVWQGNDWNRANANGTDGSETIVRILNRATGSEARTIIAKGGKGGLASKRTEKYDLCYPTDESRYGIVETPADRGIEEGICRVDSTRLDSQFVNCCNKENGTRTTKGIIASSSQTSGFDNIKSQVGNSEIVGIGLGRSGEGAGSRAGLEEVGKGRMFMNSSAWGVPAYNPADPTRDRTIVRDIRDTVAGAYANIPLRPSELNFKGGDGAVIITW